MLHVGSDLWGELLEPRRPTIETQRLAHYHLLSSFFAHGYQARNHITPTTSQPGIAPLVKSAFETFVKLCDGLPDRHDKPWLLLSPSCQASSPAEPRRR